MIGDRLLRVAHHAFVILLLVVASATVLSAQTVVDPRYVEFTPSADHSALASDGTPLVQRYSLSIFPVGSSVASATTDLGKPTPSGGIIRVDILQFLQSIPTGVVFEARVTAIGPGGSGASSVSNGFSLQAPCAPTINPTSQSVGSGDVHGKRSGDRRVRLHVVRHLERWLDYVARRDERHGQRDSAVQRRRQLVDLGAQRHADGRGPDLYGESGGALVQLQPVAHGPVGGGWRWHGLDDRDGGDRVRLDRRQQHHVVADGHERRERQRRRDGRVQRLVEPEYELSAPARSPSAARRSPVTQAAHVLHVSRCCPTSQSAAAAAARARRR